MTTAGSDLLGIHATQSAHVASSVIGGRTVSTLIWNSTASNSPKAGGSWAKTRSSETQTAAQQRPASASLLSVDPRQPADVFPRSCCSGPGGDGRGSGGGFVIRSMSGEEVGAMPSALVYLLCLSLTPPAALLSLASSPLSFGVDPPATVS